MDSNLSERQVVSMDTFAENNNVKIVFSKNSEGVGDLEEGELSDDGSPPGKPHRVVTRPALRRGVSASRVQGDVGKRNPWGGVSEGWAARVLGGRESFETGFEDRTKEIAKKSVKERLGWKRREEPGSEPDWEVKMKRPRMEMVADMEERKRPVRNQLYGANLAKRNICEDRVQQRSSLERRKGPVGKSFVYQRGKEALDKEIVRSVSNNAGILNRDDLAERDFPPLSKRFTGSLERRPRCRETIKRTVEFGDWGESDSRRGKGNPVEVVENVDNKLSKESEDSLENDNGSDLDDDSSMLIQVIQSDVESNDEESKKIKEAVRKIEEAKKREKTRRMKLKLIEEKESTKEFEKLEERNSKNRKELENQKLNEKEKMRASLKQSTKEMRVREKIKALDATEKKLLLEKSRQERLRRKIKSKKSAKDRNVKVKSRRKADSEESDSTGTETDSSSSSSSDSSEDDSSSDGSGHEEVKKKKKSCSRSKKQRVQGTSGGKGKRGWSKRASSTPKKVEKAKESSEEYKGKVSDIKSKLRDYLKKAKEKKTI